MRFPRLAAVLLAVVCSLAVVVAGPAQPAAAWAGPVGPVTIGTAVKAAPIRMITMTSPWGLAINGAALAGTALYETRDSWWPIVSEWATEGFGSDSPSPASCKHVMTATVNANGYQVTAASSKPACGVQSGFSYYFDQVSCRTPTGLLVGNAVQDNFSTHTYNSTVTRNVTVCASNSTVQSFRVRECQNTAGCASQVSNMVTYQGATSDAEWTQTATVQCRSSDGTITEISDTLTGYPDRVAVPSCADRVPGSIPWSAVIKGGPNGGVQQDIITITTNQSVFDEYADCFGPTGLICDIRVYIGGEPCTRGDAACVDWQQYQFDHPNRVECRFGSHVVAISQCAILKHAYKTKTQTVTQTDTEGNPITDPDTGSDPGTGTGGSGMPSTGTNPVTPGTVVDPSTDPDSQSCWGQAWTLNPVDWVYVPVKCAFLWAFKPQTSLQTRVQTVKDAFSPKAPFSWAVGLGTIPSLVPGGNCPDWRVKVGTLNRNVVCDQPYTDNLRAMRPVLFGFMAALAVWPLIRSVYYGAIPIVRANAGKL